MTREEAIAVLAESKRQNEVMRDNPSTFWESHKMADGVKNAERRIAALDMAIDALDPPNEVMTCDGCYYLDRDPAPCAYCIRSKPEGDHYRRPPEGEANGK